MVDGALSEWVPQIGRARGALTEAVLSGNLPEDGVAAAIRLVGRLAKRAARLRPSAEKQQEELDFQEFLRQSGVVPLVLAAGGPDARGDVEMQNNGVGNAS